MQDHSAPDKILVTETRLKQIAKLSGMREEDLLAKYTVKAPMPKMDTDAPLYYSLSLNQPEPSGPTSSWATRRKHLEMNK